MHAQLDSGLASRVDGSNIDIVACKVSLHYIRGIDSRIVLLKYRTAKCDTNKSAAG